MGNRKKANSGTLNAGHILGGLSFLMSISTFIYTCSNQKEQNRRWNEINAANISVEEINMLRWKSYTKEKAKSIDWGYSPQLYNVDILDNTWLLINKVEAFDYQTERPIPTQNNHFTVNDLFDELKANNIKSKIFVARTYSSKAILVNKGKTDAVELLVKVEIKRDSKNWYTLFENKERRRGRLMENQKIIIPFNFSYPINIPMPDSVDIRIISNYKDVNNESKTDTVKAIWWSRDNHWSYTN